MVGDCTHSRPGIMNKSTCIALRAPPAQQRPVPRPIYTGSSPAADLGVPGLLLLSGFVSPEEEVALAAAIDAAPWLAMAKRRVQHYGYAFSYEVRPRGGGVRGRAAAPAHPGPAAGTLRSALCGRVTAAAPGGAPRGGCLHTHTYVICHMCVSPMCPRICQWPQQHTPKPPYADPASCRGVLADTQHRLPRPPGPPAGLGCGHRPAHQPAGQ